MPMPARAISIILLLAICVFAPRLQSAEADDEATKLIDHANGLYIRGPVYYEEAALHYKEFLRRYPGDERCDEATFFLANCLRREEKYQEALRYFLDHQKFKESPWRDQANFRTGQVYFSLEKYGEAIPFFLKVYGKKVDDELANGSAFWLGWSYLKNDLPREAIPVLAKLADVKENPLAPWANFHLGYAYRAAGDLERAIERFRKAEASFPERLAEQKAESLFAMAEAYAKLRKYQSAYASYRELFEKHPKSSFHGRAAFGAVWSLYSAKDYADAIKAYAVCQKFIPDDSQAEAGYILAKCYQETEKLSEAVTAYGRVSASFPKSPFAAQADYWACWCLFLQDKFDEVAASGSAFVKRHPAYPEIANIHFLLGESHYQRDRIREALSQYQVVVTRYPKCPFREKASFKLGLSQLKTGDVGKARETFRAFAREYPESELAAKALARSAECGLELAKTLNPDPQHPDTLPQYREVAQDYEALVERYPADPLAGEALYQLGVTYARLDKHEEMIEAFQKLVKDYSSNPGCAEAYYWLASESQKAEEFERAIDYFERSLKLNPKGVYSEQAKHRLAEVYYKRDDKEKAAALIVEVLKSNPQSKVSQQTHLWTGDFLLQKGDYNRAIEVYELFIKKFKSSPRLEGAYYGLGDCYFKQQKWQQAIDNFSRTIEFKGEWVSLSRLSSGIAHLKLGRNKQAEELLREVERSGGTELEPKAIRSLGDMHFDMAQRMKRPEDKVNQYYLARREYLKVVILYTAPEVRPECMYRVAECLEQEGLLQESKKELLLEEARKQLQDLVKEYPKNEFARKAREKLGIAPEARLPE